MDPQKKKKDPMAGQTYQTLGEDRNRDPWDQETPGGDHETAQEGGEHQDEDIATSSPPQPKPTKKKEKSH